MDKWTEGEMVKKEKKKSSRLRMLLHLWGGICLKAFADTSGLSKLLIGSPKGSDPASAGSYAGAAGLLAVGIVGIGYFLSFFLVKAIDSSALSGRGKAITKGVLPIAYFIGAVLLAMSFGQLFASSPHTNSSLPSLEQRTEMAPVITMSTIQSSEGFTEANLNQEFLKNLESWIVETVLRKAHVAYAETGNDLSEFNPVPVSNSQYVNVGGKKLAVIKITLYPSKVDPTTATKMVRIVGFTRKGMETVGCIRNSNHDIPLWSGECGKKIREVFGVGIQP